jgi:hypothetical protein
MKALYIVVLALSAHAQPLKFAGEVKAGEEFRKPIGRGLRFEVYPTEDGWHIGVGPEKPAQCDDFSEVVAIPLRGRQGSTVDTSYGVTAAEAVKRVYRIDFVMDESHCTKESARRDIILWEYSYPEKEAKTALADFRTSPLGTATLRILDSKVNPTGDESFDKDLGKIEWIKFEVTVTFPKKP